MTLNKNFSPKSRILTHDMIGMIVKSVTLSNTPITATVGKPIGKTTYIVTDLIVSEYDSEYIEKLFGVPHNEPTCLCIDVIVDNEPYTIYPEYEIKTILL